MVPTMARSTPATAPETHHMTGRVLGNAGDSLREAFGRGLATLAEEFPNMLVLDADDTGC